MSNNTIEVTIDHHYLATIATTVTVDMSVYPEWLADNYPNQNVTFEELDHDSQIAFIHYATNGEAVSPNLAPNIPGGDINDEYHQITYIDGTEHPELETGNTAPSLLSPGW